MVPELIIDKEFIEKNWDTEESINNTLKIIEDSVQLKGSYFPVYMFSDFWVTSGVFKNFKGLVHTSEFFEYGYGDTEESISKYLKRYADDPDNNYFINISLISMDNEKYYKFGSYINKDGIDTDYDYYEYIENHKDMKVKQDFENQWIHFSVRKLSVQ